MGHFVEKIWRERALCRYKKSLSRSLSTDKVEKKYKKELTSISHLKSLVSWCAERKIEVLFNKRSGGIYYPEVRFIHINGRMNPEKQVFLLLHECGHHLIGDKEKHERFGMGYSTNDPHVKKTFQHRCDIVDEELEAWHRGWKLSRRLKLKINKSKYDKTRSNMIKTYFRWAVRAEGYGGKELKDVDDEKVMAG